MNNFKVGDKVSLITDSSWPRDVQKYNNRKFYTILKDGDNGIPDWAYIDADDPSGNEEEVGIYYKSMRHYVKPTIVII